MAKLVIGTNPKKGLRPSFRLKFTIEQSDMLLRVQLAEEVEGKSFSAFIRRLYDVLSFCHYTR